MHLLREISQPCAGAFTVDAALAAGLSSDTLRRQIQAGRITRLYPGVYVAGNMTPGRATRLWAALLASGSGAVLSHGTAAQIWALPYQCDDLIEVSIPVDRVEVAVDGVRIRRSRLLPRKATTYQGWPITTAADTVLDLASELRSAHVIVALLTDATRSRSVTARGVLEAMAQRKRQRHRQVIKDVLSDVVGGVESVLEHRYLVRVERPHMLPVGRRQVKARTGGVATRKDVDYDDFATVVELDGRLGHEGSGRHRDRRRDNANTRTGKATLRYGHADLQQPCEVAAEVAHVLQARGWSGVLTPCGPRCTAVGGSQPDRERSPAPYVR
jgi:hypothetical protein